LGFRKILAPGIEFIAGIAPRFFYNRKNFPLNDGMAVLSLPIKSQNLSLTREKFMFTHSFLNGTFPGRILTKIIGFNKYEELFR